MLGDLKTRILRFVKNERDISDTSVFVEPGGVVNKPYMDILLSPSTPGHVIRSSPRGGAQIPITDSPKKNEGGLDLVDVKASSVTRFFGDTYSPYSYSTFRDLYSYTEPSFYRDYEESWKQNPFTHIFVEYMMNMCFANGIRFEGPGAKRCEDFFWEDNTLEKIKMGWREAIKKGNGFMDTGFKGGRIARTRNLVTEDIEVELDEKTGMRLYKQSGTKLKSEFIIHFTVKDEVGNPYGISVLRSSYLFLTALMDVGGDVMAALKRVAYSPIVAKLDLQNFQEDEKATYLAAWKEKLSNVESATQNFAFDKRHDIGLLGQGSAGARLLPTNDLIEPIVAIVLMNFGIPLGMYLQTGANKAIIDEQRKAMDRFFEDMRNRIKYQIDTKLIPSITSRNTQVFFNKPPLSSEDTSREFQSLIVGYTAGILSREYILDEMNIDDSGTTFFQPTRPGDMSNDEKETSKEDDQE